MAVIESVTTPNRDVAIMRRVACGEGEAAREVYETYCDPLLRFVLRRERISIEDAEEITNDTFISAFDMAHTFDGSCSPLTWLCSIARNRIVDFRRRKGSLKRIPEDCLVHIDQQSKDAFRTLSSPGTNCEELVDQLDRVQVVQALLNTMTPEQREATLMRYVEGFSVAEIARIMKRSEKAVERLLERAKERPRREMLRWLGDPSFQALCFDLLIL